jgi:GNAT superfamily N-acetyltransferase
MVVAWAKTPTTCGKTNGVSTIPSANRPGPDEPPVAGATVSMATVSMATVSFDSDDARWVVARAEAELVERYGFLAEEEHGLVAAEFAPPGGAFVVARSAPDVRPVGGVGLRADGGIGEIKRLWVVPARRGTGIARALMGEVEQLARRQGHAKLRLETGSRQPEAVALYETSGWIRADEGWGDRIMRPGSVRFTKELGPPPAP